MKLQASLRCFALPWLSNRSRRFGGRLDDRDPFINIGDPFINTGARLNGAALSHVGRAKQLSYFGCCTGDILLVSTRPIPADVPNPVRGGGEAIDKHLKAETTFVAVEYFRKWPRSCSSMTTRMCAIRSRACWRATDTRSSRQQTVTKRWTCSTRESRSISC